MNNVWYHVAVGFGVGDDGRLAPVIERAAVNAEEAVRFSDQLAAAHAGAVAFSRCMNIGKGKYGPAIIRSFSGDLPRDVQAMCRQRQVTRAISQSPRPAVANHSRLRLVRPRL